MPYRRALPLAAVLLSLLTPAAASADVSPETAAAKCPGATAEPRPGALRSARRATRCLLNLERRAQGLRRVRGNRKLARAARRHSRSMAAANFFAHVAPTGSTVLERVGAAGYLRRADSFTVGENLGWGEGQLSTPLAMHRAWMRSPGHRANIVRPGFRHVGLGIVIGAPVAGARGAVYTQNFGTRARSRGGR